jgi:predicted nucleic acid-binding protein
LAVLDRKVSILVSVPLMVEYEAVLTRTEQLIASGLTRRDVNDVLDALMTVATPIHLRFLWRPRLKDPNDEMVLETAVNGAADVLITFNTRHLAAGAEEFGIRVVRPRDAWEEIRDYEEK